MIRCDCDDATMFACLLLLLLLLRLTGVVRGRISASGFRDFVFGGVGHGSFRIYG